MTHIDGLVQLSAYDDRRGSEGRAHSADYKRLRDAIRAGEIEGWQNGGSRRWFVNKDAADRYLAKSRREAAEAAILEQERHASSDVIECLLIEIRDTLRQIRSTLDAPQIPASVEHF